MLLSFDVAPDAIVEHDDWHTHEHMPERLAIPGFVRGSRWITLSGAPRYFVMYEVRDIGVLGSAPYRERLDHPTPWTAKMMRSYVGMRRALCEVVAGFGPGMGHAALLLRFVPQVECRSALYEWLRGRLSALSVRIGIASAHLLASGLNPQMTREQQIRGRDAGIDSALVITGYAADVVQSLATTELAETSLIAAGASSDGFASGVYGLAYSLDSRALVGGCD